MTINTIANHERTSSHMRWGLLAPITLLLFGVGVLCLGAAQQASQSGGTPWAVPLALAGTVGAWGFLALLYVINWRAARVRAAMARNSFVVPRKGGFLKGALIGTLLVVALQVVSVLIGLFYPGLDEGERNFFLVVPTFYLTGLYTVVPIAPLLGGWLGRMWRATSV